MTAIASFAEALSDYLTRRAYFTYDSKYELGQDVPQAVLEAADIVAKLGQTIEEVPMPLLREADERLIALGRDEFELHLRMSIAQIDSGAFCPIDATDYLQSFNRALAEKFGPLIPETDTNRASAVVLQFFCKRNEGLDELSPPPTSGDNATGIIPASD